MKGDLKMTLTRLLTMLMCRIDIVKYYDKNNNFLYSFGIEEIPAKCNDPILKFDVLRGTRQNILIVVEK